jgi:Lar family restriction alleviation protein
MTELKSCQFCGGEAHIQYMKEPEFFAECQQCHATSDRFLTENEVIEAWNRRV